MNEILKTLLYEWKGRKLPEIMPREKDLSEYLRMTPKKIIAVTGFRRVGKTYLLFQAAQQLLKDFTREEVVYINFEDERVPPRTDILTDLIPAAKLVFDKDISYLFLDEIQVIPAWSKWLRRMNDTTNIRIFVSGSNAKMSSKEIPTELRGRFIEHHTFPLSLQEFLQFKKVTIDKTMARHVKDEEARIRKHLDDYLSQGGLPEIVLSDEKKMEIAQSYFQTIVGRDIAERYRVENEEALKAEVLLLLNTTTYSLTKIWNALQGMHYAVGKTTLQKYLGYIENSYFLFSIPVFSHKIKDQMQHPRKVYVIDNVFLTALSSRPGKGRLFENLVAQTLMQRHRNDLFYWKNAQKEEVDFAIRDGGRIKSLIQVCVDVSAEETKKREMRALLKAGQELFCKNLVVITEDYGGIEDAEWFGMKGKIQFIPLWQWLLDQASSQHGGE